MAAAGVAWGAARRLQIHCACSGDTPVPPGSSVCWVQAVQEGRGVTLTAVHSGLVSVDGCVRRHVPVRASALSSAVRLLGRHHLLMAWVVWHHSGCLCW